MCAAQSCNKPTNDRGVALGHSKVGCELFQSVMPHSPSIFQHWMGRVRLQQGVSVITSAYQK